MVPKWMQRESDGRLFPFNLENFAKGGYKPLSDAEKDAIAAQRRAAANRMHYQAPPVQTGATVTLPPMQAPRPIPRYAIDHLQPEDQFVFQPEPGYKNHALARASTAVPREMQEFASKQDRDPLPPPKPEPLPPPPTPLHALRPEMTVEGVADVLDAMPVSEQAAQMMRESLARMDMKALRRHAGRLGVNLPKGTDEEGARQVLFEKQYEDLKAANRTAAV